jgi:hypothetical protein
VLAEKGIPPAALYLLAGRVTQSRQRLAGLTGHMISKCVSIKEIAPKISL